VSDPAQPRHRVVALVLPSVVAYDLAIPAQVFGHASSADRYAFTVCTPTPGPVPSSTGFAIDVTDDLSALRDADTIVVPGFHPVDAVPPQVAQALRDAHGRGIRIASVCVGAFALGAAGLLDDRSATTHWEFAARFRTLFPRVRLDPDVLYVDNGDVLTSAGMSAGLDLCLHLVRTDHGATVADAVARRMVVDHTRSGRQAQRIERGRDEAITTVFAWAVEHLADPIGVAEMASHVDMPVRSFTRAFRAHTNLSPMAWLREQRVLEARRLLETTALPVEVVADRSGLGTATSLRTQLARQLGTTPTAYRRQAGRNLAESGPEPTRP
jgi:transcriptional regulator GlxA family with amidase domain